MIANRGEIAVRIIRSIHKFGLEAVAVYHADEEKAMHVNLADEAWSLGSGSLSDTYLNIDKIVDLALGKSCDAIHPGYGFLSENYILAEACEKKGITFIGPRSDVIRLMGSKQESKKIAQKAGVPILEPIKYSDDTDLTLLNYPILVKASAGGGGKGMKVITSPETFHDSMQSAKREALAYFGDDELLLEPYLENARHIEVQIMGDSQGNITHLFERECSLQRNHQKIVEEAPSVSVSDELRAELCNAAVRIASVLNYTNAGTVEFLVQGNQFWFMEMNTRIQVEHPVTEAITGLDLVSAQIRIAAGEPLPDNIKNARISGHAIEVRIYAENPYNNYIPATGTIDSIHLPADIRFDTFISEGCQITPHFDAMLGKLIVHGETRFEAISKLNHALEQTGILGVNTNLHYLRQIVSDSDFGDNTISTRFLSQSHERFSKQFSEEQNGTDETILVASFVYNQFVRRQQPIKSLWSYSGRDFRFINFDVFCNGNVHKVNISSSFEHNLKMLIDGKEYDFGAIDFEIPNKLTFFLNNTKYYTFYSETSKSHDLYQYNSIIFQLSSPLILRMAGEFLKKPDRNMGQLFNQIVSPLFGKVIDVRVKAHDRVKKGDILMTIESMKTENHILSPGDGIVSAVLIEKGFQVSENKELITLNPLLQ